MKSSILKFVSTVLVALFLFAQVPIGNSSIGCLVSWMSISANAASYGDFEYTVKGTNATITNYTGASSAVVIPSSIAGYTITAIAGASFSGNKNIISVTIPGTVTELGNNASYNPGAFEGCSKLSSVTIASGTVDAYIGYRAFKDCISLETITIPGQVLNIRGNAFENCAALSSVQYMKSNGSAQKIYEYAFNNCQKLSSISLPTTLNQIGWAAFCNCTALKNVTIPEGVTVIEGRAFEKCINLETVSIPGTVTALGTNAAYDPGAFEGCSKLNAVTIKPGNNDAYLGNRAFNNCVSLTEINIPGNYLTIREKAFAGCSNLAKMTYGNSGYASATQTINREAFSECQKLSSISLPTSLNQICWAAFYHCVMLKNVTIPEGVTVIEGEAFEKCINLETVSIPSTVTALGTNAAYDPGVFEGCSKLNAVTIKPGNKDAYLGNRAFYNCVSLTEINIPGNYLTIREKAFAGCSILEKMTYGNSGYTSATQTINREAFSECQKLSSISLPTSLNKICWAAFYHCTALKNVTIPEGVTVIEGEAFEKCINLETVSIPSTVTALGTNAAYDPGAFEGCSKLNAVTIKPGNNDAYLGNRAFNNCVSLTEINIPGNYLTIREKAFAGCSNLAKMIYGNSGYASATQTINREAFSECQKLSSISLPTSLNKICWAAFYHCTALKNVTIPEGVTVIEGEAFEKCINLETVSIPGTMTALGTNASYDPGAFEGCSSLKTVIIQNGDLPCYIGNRAFRNCSSLLIAHVPSSVTEIRSKAFEGCAKLTICNTTLDCTAYRFASENSIQFNVCANNHTFQQTVKVTLNPNGGTVSPDYLEVEKGKSVTLPTPQKSDATCLGWSTSSTATTASYACGSNYTPTSDVTLYAVWKTEPVTTYLVLFDANGGTVSPKFVQVEKGKSVTLPTPTKSGATCLGWSMSSTANTASYMCGSDYTPTSDVSLYAVWKIEPVTTYYTVIFDANGGTVSPNFVEVEKGKSVTLPTPQKSDATCLGWSTSNTANTASYVCGSDYTPTSDVSLYAVWKTEPVTTYYTVTFNANGGTVLPTSVQVEKGDSVTLPLPQKSDATCLGWSTSKTANYASYVCGSNYTPTTDVTLFAVWQNDLQTIRINNYTSSRTVDYRTTITFTATVEHDTYRGQIHWFVNDKEVATGKSYTVVEAKESFSLQAKYIDDYGNVLLQTEIEQVNVNSGFFAKLIAFFRGLFGRLPKIAQDFFGVEINDFDLP